MALNIPFKEYFYLFYLCICAKLFGTTQRKTRCKSYPQEGGRLVVKSGQQDPRYKVVFTEVIQIKRSGCLRRRRMLPDRAPRKHEGRKVAFEMHLNMRVGSQQTGACCDQVLGVRHRVGKGRTVKVHWKHSLFGYLL